MANYATPIVNYSFKIIINKSCNLTSFVADTTAIVAKYGTKKLVRVLIGDAGVNLDFAFNHLPNETGKVGQCTYTQQYLVKSMVSTTGITVTKSNLVKIIQFADIYKPQLTIKTTENVLFGDGLTWKVTIKNYTFEQQRITPEFTFNMVIAKDPCLKVNIIASSI